MPSISLPTGLLTLPISDDLALLHMRALVWAAEHRTDGMLPTAALDVLSRRADVGELALRLVAAGVWTQTATGWRVVDEHRARVSAVRSAAGKRGAAVTHARWQNGQTPRASDTGNAPASPPDPRTVYAGARQIPKRVSDGEENSTTTTPTPSDAREGERVAVVVPASPSCPTQAQVDTAMAILSKASQGRFNRYAGTPADRQELALRLAGYGVNRALLERMGALVLDPKALWAWADTLRPGGYISPSWLLGRRDAHGERAAVAVEQWVGAARASLTEDARREREAAQRAEAAEAERARRENAPPPLTPDELAAMLATTRRSLADLAATRRAGRAVPEAPRAAA